MNYLEIYKDNLLFVIFYQKLVYESYGIYKDFTITS